MNDVKTTTKDDLVDAVYKSVGFDRVWSHEIVEVILETIRERLEQGDTVKLPGFSVFSVRQKSPRVGRNPKTCEEITIAGRKVVTFKGSRALCDRVS